MTPVPFLSIELKKVIKNKSCPDHYVQPEIDIKGTFMTICCCCPEFQKDCVKLARQLAKDLGLKDLIIMGASNPRKAS